MMKQRILLIFALFIGLQGFGQATKYVLVEKYTSANCGNCPDGTARLTTITDIEPNVIWVSHHAGFISDAMGFPTLDTIANAFTFGAPTATIDRVKFSGQSDVALTPNNWQSNISAQLAQTPDVQLFIMGSHNLSNNTVALEVSTNFINAVNAQNEYRLNVLVVEDSVVGSGNGYHQANYFNNTAGHPFQGLGNPITGYAHRHVVREVLTTAWGLAGVVPNNPMVNNNYTATFSYQVPSGYDPQKITFIAFLTDHNDANVNEREVLNAIAAPLKTLASTTSIFTPKEKYDVAIAPNPAKNQTTLRIMGLENQNINIQIIDLNGRVIQTTERHLSASEEVLPLDTTSLLNGHYFVVIRAGREVITKKLLIQRP